MSLSKSLDKRLAANQVLEILVALLVLLLFLDRLGDNVSQLRTIEERSRVLQDVIRAIVQDLSDEQAYQAE